VILAKRVVVRLDPPLFTKVLGKPRKVAIREASISRALENLLLNAQRYGKKVELVIQFDVSEIRITVHDNGHGIPADKREQAILPFVRLELARTQSKGGGVGLGLAIAADVAKSHGGLLILSDSEELGGLSAEIVLPF